ncbi:MAG: hypothetical protein ACYC1S_16005 [Gemmatimonadaceae bacterium]
MIFTLCLSLALAAAPTPPALASDSADVADPLVLADATAVAARRHPERGPAARALRDRCYGAARSTT